MILSLWSALSHSENHISGVMVSVLGVMVSVLVSSAVGCSVKSKTSNMHNFTVFTLTNLCEARDKQNWIRTSEKKIKARLILCEKY
jgi:hypothetical protein